MKERKLGKLRISSEQILTWIDFTNAEICDAHYDLLSDSIELMLECDEFPVTPINQSPQIINPSYTTYQDAGGNRVIIRDRGS